MRALVVWLMLAGGASAQGVIGGTVQGVPQGPPRDPRPSLSTGSSVITGRVTAGDTGIPVRRATVTVSGPGRPRTTSTDHEGRYQFTRLPKGTYTITAGPGNNRASYLTAGYGQRTHLTPPRPIELADGQVLENIDITLPRAGVIAGRVTDLSGEPAARVPVTALLLLPGAEPSHRAGATTDDLGQFRLFALPPGEYIVKTDLRMGMGGSIEMEGEALGFAGTYAPGTPNQSDALRIRVTSGSESVADIRLIETHVFKVSGQVVSATGEIVQTANISLISSDGPTSAQFSVSLGPNGTFTFSHVPPGTYEILARLMTPPHAGPGPAPMRMQEVGSLRVEVGMADVENVVVAMRLPETVTGEIVFDETPPANYRANVSFVVPERRPFVTTPRVEVTGSSFTAEGLFGPVVVRGSISAPGPSVADDPRPVWSLKAVLLDGKDITDVPIALGAAHSGRLQVLFTSRAAAIEGRVTDDAGTPTREANVVVFGADEATWTPYSSRVRLTGIGSDEGAFRLTGLRDGRYYVVAVPPELRSMTYPDRELFEALKKVATEVLLNAGETRSLELRVVRFAHGA